VTAEQASIVHTETTTQHASTHNIVQRRTQYRISSRKQFTPFDGLVFGSIRYESRQTSLRGHVNESVHFNGRYIKKKKKILFTCIDLSVMLLPYTRFLSYQRLGFEEQLKSFPSKVKDCGSLEYLMHKIGKCRDVRWDGYNTCLFVLCYFSLKPTLYF
jgi:hypothetical protein